MSRERRTRALLLSLLLVVGAVAVVVSDVPTVAAGGDSDDDYGDDGSGDGDDDGGDSDSGDGNSGDGNSGDGDSDDGTTPTESPTPTATPTPVTVEGEPDIDVFLPDNTVSPGEERRLVVQVANGGTVDDEGLDTPPSGSEAVTTARNVRVELEDGDAPVTVNTAETALGDLQAGSVAEVGFDIVVDEDADPGVYDLDVTVEYDYTEEITNDDSERESEQDTFEVELVVTEDGRFVVRSVDEDLQVGETGPVEIDLRNVGEEDLRDATVTVRSPNADLTLGGGADSSTRSVGDWDDGDTETITVDATLAPDAATQEYPLELTVSYTDENGNRETSGVLVVTIDPDDAQSFDVTDVESTLSVGQEGRVSGTVVNDGPRDVETAVLRITETDDNLQPRERLVVLGDLEEDDEADFSIPASVLDTAQPGPRRFVVVIEYVTADGDRRESDPITVIADVSSETERFELTTVDARLQANDDGPLVLTIVNRGDETLTDATVSLTSQSPALAIGESSEDTRFVGRWRPGEQRVVRYVVDAGDEAGGQTYAFEASVEFTDEEGQSRQSDPLAFGATPAARQTFDARTLNSTLRVGEEGRVTVAVTNTGPTNVSAVAVTLATDTGNVAPIETEAALGDLAAGETAVFDLPIEITTNGAPGTRQFVYDIAYTDDDGDRRDGDSLTTDVRVAPERDPFVVEREDLRVTAGQSGVIELTLTNNLGVRLTDIQAKAFADDPLSVDDDQAFIASLDPDESVTIRFTVSAAGGASEKPYLLSVDFLYTTPDGDSQLSDPVNVGVMVVQPPPQQFPDWIIPLLLGIIILIVAGYLIRRRLGRRSTPPPREDVPTAAQDGGVDQGDSIPEAVMEWVDFGGSGESDASDASETDGGVDDDSGSDVMEWVDLGESDAPDISETDSGVSADDKSASRPGGDVMEWVDPDDITTDERPGEH
ncbi:COG1361 S-layer family protein [Halobaculum limi]|uniref:COG1361 S-layer family protein n=1 Tax=Halobaculum limi TaxID=3031916 RepID=UPI002404D264|nr:hypothetical protein [Halobaculum sp. YSMS11]